jgi:hypothetical protein
MIRRACALALLALVGCASTGPAPTDDVLTFTDEFDRSTIVRQPPVNAGESSTANWSVLGFEWRSKFPDHVGFTAGTNGVVNITEVTLEADGAPLESVKPVREFTDFGDPGATPRVSTRLFEMSWPDFARIAAAKSVRLKIVGATEILVTSFGSAHAGVPVNKAVAAFFTSVRKRRGEPGE